ncbi:uncharacterized protein AruCF_1979 [Achromobacter ruhlandii]|nr:uncharacterized protein AruCF_1979 [Achromobacter ruhlandii]
MARAGGDTAQWSKQGHERGRATRRGGNQTWLHLTIAA